MSVSLGWEWAHHAHTLRNCQTGEQNWQQRYHSHYYLAHISGVILPASHHFRGWGENGPLSQMWRRNTKKKKGGSQSADIHQTGDQMRYRCSIVICFESYIAWVQFECITWCKTIKMAALITKYQKKRKIHTLQTESVLHAGAKEPSPRLQPQLDDSSQMPTHTQTFHCVYQ